MPDQLVVDEFGLNAVATSLSLPTSMITLMKKASTTAADTSASVNCTRVEICTPKYSTTKTSSANSALQAQTGRGDSALNTPGTVGSDVKIESWMYPPISTPSPAVSTMVPL